jgi:hypothetical protein
MKRVSILSLGLALLLLPAAIHSSDHADPINLKEPESNLTGLFFFSAPWREQPNVRTS